MSTHISQIILEKIQKENIKPKARWYFVMEHAALWIPGVLVTALGAASVAGICYGIAHSGWEHRDFVYKSKMDFMLAAVPMLWIVSFALFNSLIVRALRTTKEGYKLSVKKIMFGSIGTSIILGVGVYMLDERFEADSVIRYSVRAREEQIWTSPKAGRIAGRIEKKEEGSIVLRDKDGVLWTVDISGFGTTTFPFVVEGKSLRILGTSTDEIDEKDRTFIACAVFPWEIGELARRPAPPFVNGERLIKPRIQNKNPDCKVVLDDMRAHMRSGERK
jgi:hypothetical protein